MMPTTPELMKFKRLQRRLGESIRGTVGLLELMWIQVAKNCPKGDIGKFCNEEIAIMVDWDGDADALVTALVECGWIDECQEHRLVIHDWSKHAPKWVKGNVSQHLGGFAKITPRSVPRGRSLGEVPSSIQGGSLGDGPNGKQGHSLGDSPPVLPSPTQSSPTQINTMSANSGRKKIEYSEDFEEFWEAFPRFRRTQKGDAFRRWRGAVKLTDVKIIIAKAREYAQSEKGKSEYAVMPSTFISTKMWEDEPEAWGEVRQSKVATLEQLANYNPLDGGL